MMGHKGSKSAIEHDAFSRRARRMLSWHPGDLRNVKRAFAKRVRQIARRAIRRDDDAQGAEGPEAASRCDRNVVRVMEIATGQREEEYENDQGKDKNAAALGRKGGRARAERMTTGQRTEAARKAAASRWRK
jgi:hypothetical protein